MDHRALRSIQLLQDCLTTTLSETARTSCSDRKIDRRTKDETIHHCHARFARPLTCRRNTRCQINAKAITTFSLAHCTPSCLTAWCGAHLGNIESPYIDFLSTNHHRTYSSRSSSLGFAGNPANASKMSFSKVSSSTEDEQTGPGDESEESE